MYIREVGEGPAVLLLHGAPSPAEDFAPLARALSSRARVLTPDLPGYGGTPALDGVYAWDRVVGMLVDELARRGLEEVTPVGFSGGSALAIALATSGKVGVKAVVTLGGFVALDEAGRAGMHQFARLLRGGADVSAPEWGAIMVARMLSPAFAGAHPERAAEVARWLMLTSPAVLADELEEAAKFDGRPGLARLEAPVVAVVGELDASLPVAYSEEIARVAKRGRLEVVAGSGHSLLLERPEETIALISGAVLGT